MVFIAMFSNSWMTGEDDFNTDFGLSEFEFYDDDDSESGDYSDDDCQDDDDCADVGAAGTTGLIFLWIAVAAAIGSLVLMCLNNFNVYNSKFGMIACFVSGVLAIAGAIIWLIMFPDIEQFDDFDLGPGMDDSRTRPQCLVDISWCYCGIVAGILTKMNGNASFDYNLIRN